ncbi:MAG TPA: hypothetical protein PLN31_19625 [Azoarcus taiwanensis]|nr:hypothetical protein [Azoarcus taiwanensis]
MTTEYRKAVDALEKAEAAYGSAAERLRAARAKGAPGREVERLRVTLKESEQALERALCNAEFAHREHWKAVVQRLAPEIRSVVPLIGRYDRSVRAAGGPPFRAAFSLIEQVLIDTPPDLGDLLDAGVPFEAPDSDLLAR